MPTTDPDVELRLKPQSKFNDEEYHRWLGTLAARRAGAQVAAKESAANLPPKSREDGRVAAAVEDGELFEPILRSRTSFWSNIGDLLRTMFGDSRRTQFICSRLRLH